MRLTRTRSGPGLLAALALAAAAAPGCIFGSSGDDDKGGECVSSRQYFLETAWPKVFGKSCVTCHAPDGQAAREGAALQLLPSTYPGFTDLNLESMRELAKLSYEGKPHLVQKPLGVESHGGGKVVEAGSEEATIIEELAARLSGASECAEQSVRVASFPGVRLADPPATLRKATLALGGRLPTADEEAKVAGGDERALEAALEPLLDEDAFYDRLVEIFNDAFLTDKYLYSYCNDDRALNLIDDDAFPNRFWFSNGAKTYDGARACCDTRDTPECKQVLSDWKKTADAVAREPLNLVRYVAQNNLPFSQVLTGDYVVVNPYSARAYGVEGQVTFRDPADADELQPARLGFVRRDGQGDDAYDLEAAVPHAGVLTTGAFLNRFPTTVTNRNRHRARVVMSLFLATDILKVAERPVTQDDQDVDVIAPTMNKDTCVVCHQVLDPIAGAFQRWNYNDQDRFEPEQKWFSDMFQPGYGKQTMEAEYYARGLQWLAPRLAADPRFALAAVYTVYQGLTGQAPLRYPTDAADPLYAQRVEAWAAQDATFRAVADAFVADDLNIKTVFKRLVASPYFRAAAGPEGADERARAALAGLGAGQLLTPEQLDRKIGAVVGYKWSKGADGRDPWLRTDFYMPYGGHDSDQVTARTTNPNGVIANVGLRMANEVACRHTAFDFTRPKPERKFFPEVERDVVPEAAGNPVPGNIELIKKNLVHLHQRVLGERLAADDPEIERSYQLFLETWREASAYEGDAQNLPFSCRARWTSPDTTAQEDELPEGERIEKDEDGTLHAWMAVMSYLFSDYKFLLNY
ncbi:MAG TPA: hypothetical protein VFS43_45845 [Polyangiaceae bacterium]|nr:hypothetical protein [Polyangiaceae bacterium]